MLLRSLLVSGLLSLSLASARLITSDIVGPGFPPRRFTKHFEGAAAAAAAPASFICTRRNVGRTIYAEEEEESSRCFWCWRVRETSTRLIDPRARQKGGADVDCPATRTQKASRRLVLPTERERIRRRRRRDKTRRDSSEEANCVRGQKKSSSSRRMERKME